MIGHWATEISNKNADLATLPLSKQFDAKSFKKFSFKSFPIRRSLSPSPVEFDLLDNDTNTYHSLSNGYSSRPSHSPFIPETFETIAAFFAKLKESNPSDPHKDLFDNYRDNVLDDGYDVKTLKRISNWNEYGVEKKGHLARIEEAILHL